MIALEIAIASSAVLAGGHVVLNKRDTRAAVAWVGLILLVPALGPLLYILLGINRIERRATRLRRETPEVGSDVSAFGLPAEQAVDHLAADAAHLAGLVRLIERTTSRPLVDGNRIEPLRDGDEAYPAMLEAIASAQRSIALATYIFDSDAVGRRFVDALVAARARGARSASSSTTPGLATHGRRPIDSSAREASPSRASCRCSSRGRCRI